jgi:hypothetical protein
VHCKAPRGCVRLLIRYAMGAWVRTLVMVCTRCTIIIVQTYARGGGTGATCRGTAHTHARRRGRRWTTRRTATEHRAQSTHDVGHALSGLRAQGTCTGSERFTVKGQAARITAVLSTSG